MKFDDTRYIVHEGCDHIFFVGFLVQASQLWHVIWANVSPRYVDTDRLAEKAAGKSLGDITPQTERFTSRHRNQSLRRSSIKNLSW